MILLMGGTGFLGKHVSNILVQKQIRTVSLSRSPDHTFLANMDSNYISGATLNSAEADSALANAKTIVYMAHTSRPGTNINNLSNDIVSNVLPFSEFLQHAAQRNPHAKIIYLSSGGQVYGPVPSDRPIKETTPLNPVTPYGFGKKMSEEVANFSANSNSQSNVTILRLGNPVGYWQMRTNHGFVAAAVRSAITGDELTLFGAGNNLRDYFDADDFGAFIANLHGKDELPTGAFNIGTGLGLTENSIIEIVQKTLQKKIVYQKKEARGFDLPYGVLNVEKAKKYLGWKAPTPLEQTIIKMAGS